MQPIRFYLYCYRITHTYFSLYKKKYTNFKFGVIGSPLCSEYYNRWSFLGDGY